jgi:Peptidase_C39 like family
LARLAATSVAVGVAITVVSPPATAAAAAAPSDPPSGAVDPGPSRPDVPDARMKNPAPSNPGPSNSAPSDSAPSGSGPSAPAPQRKDKPPDRDAHKFSPAKRTPAGQSDAKRDNDNKNDERTPATTSAPPPAWVPAPAPASPGSGQGASPQAGPAAMLNGMTNVLVSANRTMNEVVAAANQTVAEVVRQLPAPNPRPGLTVVSPPKKPKPKSTSDFDTQEYRPAEEGTGTRFADYDLFERPPHIIGMPERDLTAEVPGYEVQEQWSEAYADGWVYYCGPASAQNTLAILGIDLSQDQLRDVLGTTENGTDTIDQVTDGLNGVLADHGETPVYATEQVAGGEEIHPVTGKPAASPEEIKQVRQDVRGSIAKGYPVVVNVTETAPGVTINGEPHGYPGHYVTVVGYDKEADTVKIADSAYAPEVDANGNQVGWQSGTYEMKTEDLAHWSAGKGYSHAEGHPAPGT